MSIRLSYSLVKTLLEDCAWQVALERIVGLDGPPHPRSASGTAYHAAIELHEQARIDGGQTPNAETMIELAQASLEEQDPGWPPAMLEGALEEAAIAVTNWWAAPIPKGQPGAGGTVRDRIIRWTPISVEERLIIDLPTGNEFVGVIDAVYETDTGDLVPVDQKSARKFDRYPVNGRGLGQQSGGYVELIAAVHGWDVDRFEYHVVRVQQETSSRFQRVRVVPVVPTDLDRAELADRLKRAQEVLDERKFPKTTDWFLCSPEWCPFHVGAGGPCDPKRPQEFLLPPA